MRFRISAAERAKSTAPSSFLKIGARLRLRGVLRARMNRASLQSAQGLDDQIRTYRGKAGSQSLGGIVGLDREFFLEQDVAGIEPGVDAHCGDAGDGLAVCDGPLDRSRTAIFRQQRGVEVDVAESREIEHPLRNDAAVADDDDSVGLESRELSAEFFVGLDAVGLDDGKIQLQCRLFDRRRNKFKAASFGTVGLCHDQMHAESGGDQLF